MNIEGIKMHIRYMVLYMGILLCFTGLARAEKHALLIGVGDYIYDVKDLKGPPHDVEVLKDLLIEKWNFDEAKITTLVDHKAGRDAILNALDNLSEQTSSGDFIFVYFSGHGTSWYDEKNKVLRQGDLTPNTGALLPADLDLDQTVEVILAQLIIGTRDLRPRFRKLDQGRQVLAVFDACYSGESVRSIRARSMGALAPRGVPRSQDVFSDLKEELTQLGDYTLEVHDDNTYPYQNVVYISASSMREEALDLYYSGYTLDGRPHGALTDALLRGLSGEANTNGDTQITTRELYSYVKQWVSSRHRHTPQLRHSKTASLDQSVLGAASNPGIPQLMQADQPLRVGLQSNAAKLRDQIAVLAGVKVSADNSDVRVGLDSGVYKLYLANGEFLGSYYNLNTLLHRIQNQARIKKLAVLHLPKRTYNVFVEPMGSSDFLVEGDKIGFRIRSEKKAYIVLLNVNPHGSINILYPCEPLEKQALAANRELSLDIGHVYPPFGTELIRVLAFRERSDLLDQLNCDKSFRPTHSLFESLMEAINRAKASGGLATDGFWVTTYPKE